MTPGRLLVVSLAAYAVLLGLSWWLLSTGLEESPWRYAVALLPVPAGLGVAVSAVAEHRSMDELMQRLHLLALAVAVSGTALTALSWGFLEGVGLPPLGGFGAFGLLVVFYVVGLVGAQARYR